MKQFLEQAIQYFDYTRELRRDFHRHPELGFQEVRTSGIVARELKTLGLEVYTGIAETGVVGLLETERPGPVALLRFDMDALPIKEQTDTEYASQNPGVMHACGHDGHTAIGLTVARLLQARRDKLRGTIKLVFQPAEEGMGGAERMVAEGVLEDPRPDFALAMHLWNIQPLGWIGVSNGPTMAASEIFRVRIFGKGGHAALPNLAADPLLASAQVITALQSIVASNISPLQSAVVSVTSIHGGTAFNIIPPEIEMQGTIRTFEPALRRHVLERMQEITKRTAEAMGCQGEMDIQPVTPALINNPRIAEHVQLMAARMLPESEISTDYRTMGSEDMAFMMQDIPGCYFFVGSANPEKGLDAEHHHPRFDFDEQALPRAAALMAAAVTHLLD